MEGNGLSGRMYSNVGGGMLGLEMPLHPQPPQTTTQNPSQNPQTHLQKHPQMMSYNLQQQQQQEQQQTQLSMKQPTYPYPNNPNPNPPQKIKTQMSQSTNSDEDEPNCGNDEGSFDGKRKSISPWQRMKWTDNMVRLLIMAVYYIGDEAGSDLGSDKKKSGSSGPSGILKKGKWKSVSRAMMEKGFYVSPQQCEDKFNDLNKRYKRVNDILGKGTACKVVENQSLLDTMDLSPKMKDEARKLLNSKHLFFREMCAYHNSCGHNTTNSSSDHHQMPQQQQQQQQQTCLHSSTSGGAPIPPTSMVLTDSKLDNHNDDGDENDDDDEEDDDDDEFDDEEEEHDEGGARKRAKTMGGISSNNSNAWPKLSGEMMGMLQDGSKSSWEKKQWVMTQLAQLEENGVKIQYQALELEKQRLKWIKFSSKKEREMERMKLDNEKSRLQNERMVLLLRRKEIELLVVEQQHRTSNPSCVTG